MFRSASWVALLGLFFASGASGLIYEIVWMRLLSLTMSVTVYAVTTVLCAFMAGLALGAAIAGRVAHRVQRPMLAYGCIEMALAAVALITPTLLFHLGPVYASLHAALGGGTFGFAVARFLLAFAVLLVPSTLMGTTLPLLSRAVIQSAAAVGRGAGALYAVNTLGAVAGCVAAGFILIPNLGLSLTNGFAATVSLLVGISAVLLGRNLVTTTDAAEARHRAASTNVRIAYVAIAVSGFTALGYQVLWTRALEQFTHNSTYAYSAILATFLLGIAVGSAVAAPIVDKLRRPLLGLAVVELAIAGSVVAALLIYANMDRVSPLAVAALGGLGSWGQVVALIFVQASSVLLATTFLFGMTFPFVARVVVEHLDGVGERIATAYTANTAGSIFGSVVIGFLVLPVLGMQGTFLALAALNALVGLVLVWRATEGRGRVIAVGAVAALAVVTAALLPQQMFQKSFVRRFGPLPFYREEVTDTIMVTDDAKRGRMIRYGDGRGTAGTGTVKEDRFYAEIPMLLHERPLRVLNICFGVGNSLSSVSMHPVERIDSVELSPGVVDAAPFFASTNRDVLSDRRIHMTIADGRNFLLLSRDKYDIIRLDPPELHTAGVVNLYTKEFYELARDHLAPGGIFSIWVNVVMTPEEDLKHLVRTLNGVFPYVSVWHGPLYYSWVINGSMTPHDPDLERLVKKFTDPKIRSDMESIGVNDPFAFLSHFVFAGDDVKAWYGDGPIVTDDRTRLDFTVPRSLDSSYGFANANTDSWMADQMEQNLAVKTFFRKIQQMNAHKKPVLPHLANVEGAGFTQDQVRERMAAQAEAAAKKPVTTAPADASASPAPAPAASGAGA
ncbi:MAG: fused MFS/spermidine synthase [Candidatus Binatia bacterium]